MTFLEAIKQRKPMRRVYNGVEFPWMYLGFENEPPEDDSFWQAGGYDRPQWRCIGSGKIVGLSYEDYEATDWEIMS